MTMHVDDGALVRYLDREAGADERETVGAHLGACDACAGRLAQLERRSAAFTAALRTADPDRRAAPARRWGLRAAAAILVVLAVGGTVRPVRAWIVERAQAIWAALSGDVGDAAIPGDNAAVASTAVSFVPADGAFTVEIARWQAGGRLTLEVTAGDTARAAVAGGSGAESLVVLPARLRIVNPAASTASYRLTLPDRLGRVRVIVADGPARIFDVGDGTVNIELGGR
jgi:anti-sigma factor RsiW